MSSLGINCEYIRPKDKGILQLLAESHDACRQQACRIGADYMLHLESDNFPESKQVIERLMMHDKKVVSSYYSIGFGSKRQVGIILRTETSTNKIDRKIGDEALVYINGELRSCFNAGLGCTLIHKSVFKKIRFRWMPNVDVFPDLLFAQDLWDNGIKFHVDTSLICEHRNIEWGLYNINYK